MSEQAYITALNWNTGKVETHTYKEWSLESGNSERTMQSRMRLVREGEISIEQAIFEKPNEKLKKRKAQRIRKKIKENQRKWWFIYRPGEIEAG